MEMTQDTGGGASPAVEAYSGKHLSFRLMGEEYAIEITKVQEIIGIMPIAKVPRMPAFVRGVINLRGRIIPTIDLRRVFGMPPGAATDRQCIIVMEMQGKQGKLSMGVIVDEVADVIEIQADQVDRPPQMESMANNECLLGFVVIDESVKTLLNVDEILSGADMSMVEAVPEMEAETESEDGVEAAAETEDAVEGEATAETEAAPGGESGPEVEAAAETKDEGEADTAPEGEPGPEVEASTAKPAKGKTAISSKSSSGARSGKSTAGKKTAAAAGKSRGRKKTAGGG